MIVESDRIGWQRNRRARVLSRSGMALLVVVLAWDDLRDLWGGIFYDHTLHGAVWVAMAAAFLASLVTTFAHGQRPAAVEVGPVAVRVGPRTIARSRITSAYVVSRYVRARIPLQAPRRAPTVEMMLADGDVVSFEVASFEAARVAVAELGFGPGQRRVTLALGSPARRLYHVLMAVGAYYLATIVSAPLTFAPVPGYVSTAFMVAALFGLYFTMKALARPPSLVVGSDGVEWRWGVRSRFIPGSAIRSVEQASIALPLLLHTSERQIPIVIDGKALDIERRGAAATLLHDRFVGPVSPTADAHAAAAFARRDRSLVAWRNDLAAQAREPGYRQAAGREDVAHAVLASARATGEERVGAALALRVAGEPAARLRVAAEAAAEPGLRDALEAVADEESDDALDRALRRLRR